MNKRALYPLADRVPLAILKQLPEARRLGGRAEGLRARWNGEFRAPKAGEWYLSGASIAAYRAPNDLPTTSLYHIAELVDTDPRTEPRIVVQTLKGEGA